MNKNLRSIIGISLVLFSLPAMSVDSTGISPSSKVAMTRIPSVDPNDAGCVPLNAPDWAYNLGSASSGSWQGNVSSPGQCPANTVMISATSRFYWYGEYGGASVLLGRGISHGSNYLCCPLKTGWN